MVSRRVILFISMLSLSAFAQASAIAQDEPKTNSAEVPDARVRELVKQLDSSVFATREHATEALLEIGQPALGSLRLAANEGGEAGYRASMIIDRVETVRFEALSKSFLVDPDANNSYGLPAWDYYQQIAGTSRTSKLLFLDMIRDQPDLAGMIDATFEASKADPQSLALATDELREKTVEESIRLISDRMDYMRRPMIGDVVAILLATSLIEGQAPVEINELLDSSAQAVPVSTYMQRRGYSSALRSLYSAWVPKTHEAMAYRVIYLSLRSGLATGVDVARRQVTANVDARMREQVIQCIARFGDKTDLPRLAELLEDATVVSQFPESHLPSYMQLGIQESHESPPGADVEDAPAQVAAMMQYRVCDLAMAAILMLEKSDVEEFLPRFVPHEEFAFDPRGVAVLIAEETLANRQHEIDRLRAKYAPSTPTTLSAEASSQQ